jgi:phosphoribosylaminoimidazolecarboxamide formyltransferase/IMP cyclohydrolase
MMDTKITRALISVSDKAGLPEFAAALAARGVAILSTGGTARALRAAGLEVTDVSAVTGFPEMLDGRVKTLHPAVHGGILARRDLPEHMAAIAEAGILGIGLVCVNLYPFAATTARPDCTLDDAVENIDIGGPAMVRSAAKNHADVTVVVDPADYASVLEEMDGNEGCTGLELRRRLAVKAFRHTGAYDAMVSQYLGARLDPETKYPGELAVSGNLDRICRYGENPHQSAAFYVMHGITEPCVSQAQVLHGKELSFNNLADANAAIEAVKEFDEAPAAVIVKHMNPCGVAMRPTVSEAFRLAREADPVSAFGGILAVNRPMDAETASVITEKNSFFEVIAAPSYEPEAYKILTGAKAWSANVRILELGSLEGWRGKASGVDMRSVVGGLLVQDRDIVALGADDLTCVTERQPTDEEVAELLFAWRIVRHVKSNAIVFSRERRLVGVGAGQMNRVQSVRLAVGQAGALAQGAVMASDAFFPFNDGPQAAADAGIRAIIQPGGSKRDQETIELCNASAIAMVYTGRRHFRH